MSFVGLVIADFGANNPDDYPKFLEEGADSINKGADLETQVDFFDNLLEFGKSAVPAGSDFKDSNYFWNLLTGESKKKLLKNVLTKRLERQGFSYFHDFLGLGKETRKDILTNYLGEIIPAIKTFDKADMDDLFEKNRGDISLGFNKVFIGEDENAKLEAVKFFSDEWRVKDGKLSKRNFLTSEQKNNLFNALDLKTKEELLKRISDYRYSVVYGKFPDGRSAKINSLKIEEGGEYKWKGNKFGVADEKGNLKVWLDFDDLAPQITDVKFEKGILEIDLFSKRKITLDGGSLNSKGNLVRNDGTVLGGLKHLNVMYGSVSEGDNSQIDARYDEDGFVTISLSGNVEQTVLAGKDAVGNDFIFSQFHQDEVGKDGKVVKDTQKAEILVAPNDDVAAKSAIIKGAFGRKVTSKTGFTQIGSKEGLLGGDRYSSEYKREQVVGLMKNIGESMGGSIAKLSKYPILQGAITGVSPGGPNLISGLLDGVNIKFFDASSTVSEDHGLFSEEGFLDGKSVVATDAVRLGFENRKEVEGFFDAELTSKGVKIIDEGKGYGVVDVTKSIYPIAEVKIRSDTIVEKEGLSGQTVGLRYLINGNSMLRFGKEATYIERSVEGAAVSINSIVNRNLKDKNGDEYSLKWDNYEGNSRYSLYLDQDVPGLKEDQKVVNHVVVGTVISYGERSGFSPSRDVLLEFDMEFKPGESVPSKLRVDNVFSASGDSIYNLAVQGAYQKGRFIGRRAAGLGIFNFGIIQRKAMGQAAGQIYSGIQQGLAKQDPAQFLLGEARTTMGNTIRDAELSFGGGNQQKGREVLVNWARQALSASESGIGIMDSSGKAFVTLAEPLNLEENVKDGINFYLNYEEEVKKFDEFRQKASLAKIPAQGGSYLEFDFEKGTMESNGHTLYSPFITRQIMRNLASDSGMARINVVRRDVGGEYSRDPSAISRFRTTYSGRSYSSPTSSSSGGTYRQCTPQGCNYYSY